jgi:type IV pilus assembly protein PilV
MRCRASHSFGFAEVAVRHPVGGFTLIEVLVALFVLAVGIAGAAATQAAAERTRHDSALMSGAVRLAASLAERMRANPVAMAAGDAANPYSGLDYDASGGPPMPPPALCFGAADCSPADLAEHDLYDIRRALYVGFPDGRIRVCRDAGAGAAPGGLSWDCSPSAGAPLVIKVGWRRRAGEAGEFAPSVAIAAEGAS